MRLFVCFLLDPRAFTSNKQVGLENKQTHRCVSYCIQSDDGLPLYSNYDHDTTLTSNSIGACHKKLSFYFILITKFLFWKAIYGIQ